LRALRAEAAATFAAATLPTPADELWRYTPIAQLDLGRFTPVDASTGAAPAPAVRGVSALADAVADRSGIVWIVDGRLASVDLDAGVAASGVTVRAAGDDAEVGLVRPVDSDALTALHDAFVADVVVVHVPASVIVDRPLVVVQVLTVADGATFAHLVVETGESSAITVLDHQTSADGLVAYTSPVVELRAGDNADLQYIGVQDLGESVWSTGYLQAKPGRDARVKAWIAALGGGYARLYVDTTLAATGGAADIAAVYFGEDDQTHDFRSMQDHLASRSASNFVLKGAVVDAAHGVYTGLIRVHEGAKATDSFLTNRNLVLSDNASVDSVPNLEIINENDIRSCGHAAATGPVDEEHLFYLESRGVPSAVAERLIVFGFFDDVVSTMPVPEIRDPLRHIVARKLDKAIAK